MTFITVIDSCFFCLVSSGCITLSDLKNCKLAYIFFNTFFNLDKYLEFEQRDPFAAARVCRLYHGFLKVLVNLTFLVLLWNSLVLLCLYSNEMRLQAVKHDCYFQ